MAEIKKKYQITLNRAAAVILCESALATFADYSKTQGKEEAKKLFAEVGLGLAATKIIEDEGDGALIETITAVLTLSKEILNDARTTS